VTATTSCGDPAEGPRPVGRPGARLTVLMSTHDHVRHTSLRTEIIKRARRASRAGATVFEGTEGFGQSGQVHRTPLVRADPPLAVVVVDEPDRVERFLEGLAPLLHDVAVIVEDVEILDT